MTNSIKIQNIIPTAFHGQRLDPVLASLYPDYSRSLLTKWIKEGFITLNDQLAKPRDKVTAGDKIDIDAPMENHRETDKLLPQNIPLDIIYEDDYLLIINKQAGLVVHPGAGNPESTLVNALLYHDETLQQLSRAGIIHRLDKDTTGLMVIAKTLPAYTELIRQMQAREINRHYQALVQGYLISGGEIDTAFGRHHRNRLKMAVLTQGKQALTYYKIREHFEEHTLLDIQLMTGRTHQIRVHMAHINHPVIGDQLYGGRPRFPKNADESLRDVIKSFKRQALHACKLSFIHPVSKEQLTFHAPLPEDFKRLIKAIREHDEAE